MSALARCLGLALLLAVSALAQTPDSNPGDPEPVGRAFVNARVDLVEGGTAFVGQPVVIDLQFGLEREFLDSNVLQPFRRQLDVPVTLDARWLDGGDGYRTTPLGETDDGTRPLSAVFAGDVGQVFARLDQLRDGRRFACFGLRVQVIVERAGRLTLPPVKLGYTYATTFDEDFLNGRVARDPRQAEVAGEDLVIDFVDPPTAGRPSAFRGAIGRYRLTADTDAGELDLGSIFELTVTVRATAPGANLDTVTAPPLDELDGFHVVGRLALPVTDEQARAFRYDLALVDRRATTVPALEFGFFDPGPPPRYDTARSEPLPLQVKAGDATGPGEATGLDPDAGTTAAPAPSEPRLDTDPDATPPPAGPGTAAAVDLVRDIRLGLDLDTPDASRLPGPPAWLVLLLLTAPWLVAGLLHARHRELRRRAAQTAATAARHAAAARREESRSSVHAAARDGDLTATYRAFTDFLAAWLARSPAQVADLDRLAATLAEHQVPTDVIEGCRQWLSQQTQSRYGHRNAEIPPLQVAAQLADAIASQLANRGSDSATTPTPVPAEVST